MCFYSYSSKNSKKVLTTGRVCAKLSFVALVRITFLVFCQKNIEKTRKKILTKCRGRVKLRVVAQARKKSIDKRSVTC